MTHWPWGLGDQDFAGLLDMRIFGTTKEDNSSDSSQWSELLLKWSILEKLVCCEELPTNTPSIQRGTPFPPPAPLDYCSRSAQRFYPIKCKKIDFAQKYRPKWPFYPHFMATYALFPRDRSMSLIAWAVTTPVASCCGPLNPTSR